MRRQFFFLELQEDCVPHHFNELHFEFRAANLEIRSNNFDIVIFDEDELLGVIISEAANLSDQIEKFFVVGYFYFLLLLEFYELLFELLFVGEGNR